MALENKLGLTSSADLEFPKATYFRSGHISFLYPGEYRITADAEVFANLFH